MVPVVQRVPAFLPVLPVLLVLLVLADPVYLPHLERRLSRPVPAVPEVQAVLQSIQQG